MIKQFQIFKQGMTDSKVTILSKVGEEFDFNFKVSKYKYLGYQVFDMDNNLI